MSFLIVFLISFLFVGLIYLAVLIGLNFINVKWVKLLVLILGGLPILIFGNRAINSRLTQSKYDKQAKEYSRFMDSHLEAMRMAMAKSDLKEMEALLSKDNSQINKVGENNRRTILGIAFQNEDGIIKWKVYSFSLNEECLIIKLVILPIFAVQAIY